ncbi:MAG: 6-bladed beta-propeller [Calditrichaeota bacterium]|nr:6-bladed beta-propeller [Calditrichota bacterium]
MIRNRFATLLLGIFGFLLMVATRVGAQTSPGNEVIVFPPPPDTARIQFLARFSESTDITGRRSGFLAYILGKQAPKPIIKPYGLAIRHGVVYICDTIVAGLEIIDLKRKTFRYFKPRGLGLLRKPINCYVDGKGYLYVADTGRQQVVIYDDQLGYVNSIGGPAEMKPTDVQVVDNKIWVTDLKSHKVRVYHAFTHELLNSFPEADADTAARLFSPTNLYVTRDRVYVSDIGDFKVKIYTRDGKFVRSVGSYGRGLGQFARPKGIAVDRDGNLYVVDAAFENVQIFDRDGHLLMPFGGPYEGPGYMWLPAKVVIDYDNLELFRKFVDKRFRLKYLIFVTNQYGPDKVNVYGFVEPR